jgi:hypothetical protein
MFIQFMKELRTSGLMPRVPFGPRITRAEFEGAISTPLPSAIWITEPGISSINGRPVSWTQICQLRPRSLQAQILFWPLQCAFIEQCALIVCLIALAVLGRRRH